MAEVNIAQSVEEAEKFLQSLKDKAAEAHTKEDVFMMGIFTELIAVASPIVTRAIARQHRESRAKINADHKALRVKINAEKEAAKSKE